MAKTSYLSTSDDGFAYQLQTFKNAIGAYAAGLGVAPAQVTAQAADADYFRYVLQCQEIMQNAAKQWTAWKDLARRGGIVPPTGAPVIPTFLCELGLARLQRLPRPMRAASGPRRRQGFVMLAIDTTPGYSDTQPFPAAPAK